ncbi:MAG: porin [Roseiarcus sp.]|jgi:hypothetical protein
MRRSSRWPSKARVGAIDHEAGGSLSLGAAAALALVAGAQAADLATWKGAPAAEYVKVCKDGDIAGFVIPGSDTCLRISGYVRAEMAVGKVAEPWWASAGGLPTAPRYASDISYFTRGQVNFDAVAKTAMGPLLAHMELRANGGDSRFDWTSGPTLHAGYVQWAGFTVGKHSSFFWSPP